jgi:hypothetical protein
MGVPENAKNLKKTLVLLRNPTTMPDEIGFDLVSRQQTQTEGG